MNYLKLPVALLLLSLIFGSCQKQDSNLLADADLTLHESKEDSRSNLNFDSEFYDEALVIYEKNVYLKDGRLIFESIGDADHVRSSIVNDPAKRTLLEELKGFISSKSAFMAATKELSEAAVLTGVDAYSDIGLLVEDSEETSYEKVVDDPGLQYMANQEAIFQIAGDIYKIYRDFALVVPEDIFFSQSKDELLNNESFTRIPINRSNVQRVNIHACNSEWRENGQRRKRRRVKGELEHRTNIFNGKLTGNIRTKGQRRSVGIWWQYDMNIIRHEGSVGVIPGYFIPPVVVDVYKQHTFDDEIDTEVFQCDDCPGFCGSLPIEHYAVKGGNGSCYTQPPFQGPCI